MAALDYNHVFFDEGKGGAPYYIDANGARHYLSPSEAAQVRPSQVGDDDAWDKSEAFVDWDKAGLIYWIDPATGSRRYFALKDGVSVEDALRVHAWASGTYGAEIKNDGTPWVDYNPSGEVPGSGLFKERGYWDGATGQYKQNTNWNNIISIGVGTFLTFGAIDAFAGGAAGGSAVAGGGGSVASGGSAGAAGTAGGSLVSTIGGAVAAGGAAIKTALGIKQAIQGPREATRPVGSMAQGPQVDWLSDSRVQLAIGALVLVALLKGKR